MTWTIRDRVSGFGDFGTYDNPNELITDLDMMIERDMKEEHTTREEAGEYYEVFRSDGENFLVDASKKELRFKNVDTWEYAEL